MTSDNTAKAILLFDFEGAPVRVVQIDAETRFVLTDVCRVLEHSNPTMAAKGLDEDEKGLRLIETPGGPQKLITVTESGLYALIMTSHKPNAKAFRKWVTSQVLPAIRRTGGYVERYVEQVEATGPTETDETGYRALKAFLKAASVMEDQANNTVALSGLVIDHVDELRKKTASLRVEEAHLGIALKHAIDMIEATAIRPPALVEQKLRAAYAEIDQLRDRERAVYDRLLAATDEIVALRLKFAKAKTTPRLRA